MLLLEPCWYSFSCLTTDVKCTWSTLFVLWLLFPLLPSGVIEEGGNELVSRPQNVASSLAQLLDCGGSVLSHGTPACLGEQIFMKRSRAFCILKMSLITHVRTRPLTMSITIFQNVLQYCNNRLQYCSHCN